MEYARQAAILFHKIKRIKMKNTRAQISFEFILIFSLILFSLIGFIYLINLRITEISEQQEATLIKNLANSIKGEVILASSVNNNYLRKFDIPNKINGERYNMTIENDELTISVEETMKNRDEYFTVFPVHVKGSFIDDINENTTKHCITKNDRDGIRISRNQASIDSNSSVLKAGDRFDVYVSLYCVENIRSIQFTIKYDPAVLELKEAAPITNLEKELNPLFDEVKESRFENLILYLDKEPNNYVDATIGRFTYGIVGESCGTGSGSIAKLHFRVKDDAAIGTTEIRFDDGFGDLNLYILDCKANALTKEAMPDSKKNAKLEIG
jgi:uncharacterized protein (UPF0333 family)